MEQNIKQNYIYLTAEHFKEDKSTYLAYKEQKDQITDYIKTIGSYATRKDEVINVLKCIQLYQGIGKDERELEKCLNNIKNFNKDFKIEQLQEAYNDGIKNIYTTGYFNNKILETSLEGNKNIKKIFYDNSYGGYKSNQELLDSIIKQLLNFIMSEDVEKISDNANYTYGYSQLYQQIKKEMNKYKESKNQGNQDEVKKEIEDNFRKMLSSSGKIYKDKWRKQMIKSNKKLTKIFTPNYTDFLLKVQNHFSKSLGIKKSAKQIPNTIYSDFQETFLASAFNMALENIDEAISVGKTEKEKHKVFNMKITEKENGQFEYQTEEKYIDSPKQIKTDLTIKTKEDNNPTNLSLKFYSTKKTENIHLEDMTIMKILSYENPSLLFCYNNFLSAHKDENETYKNNKDIIIFYLGFLMLMRAWTGLSPNSSIQDNNTGPAGLFVIQDNTTGDYWVLDISKELDEIFKTDKKYIDQFFSGKPLDDNLTLSENIMIKGDNNGFQRNAKVLSELNERYQNLKFAISFPTRLLKT